MIKLFQSFDSALQIFKFSYVRDIKLMILDILVHSNNENELEVRALFATAS